jgi:hypothetical protein
MNEIVSVLIEHGAEFAILDPALRAAGKGSMDLVKDWIGPQQVDAIKDTFGRAWEKLKRRRVTPQQPPLSILVPLLDAARDESREELRDAWAALLAAAADPSRLTSFRREFIDIVRHLEPIDVRVLPMLNTGSRLAPSRKDNLASRLGIGQDQIELAFRNLEKRELAHFLRDGNPEMYPAVTALGRQLLMTVAD